MKEKKIMKYSQSKLEQSTRTTNVLSLEQLKEEKKNLNLKFSKLKFIDLLF